MRLPKLRPILSSLLLFAILTSDAEAKTHKGSWGTFSGIRGMISKKAEINALFHDWLFMVSGKTLDIDWNGTLLDRRHSAILLKDGTKTAPNVTIHICGGGSTTVKGCKASLGHFRETGSDVIAAYVPQERWYPRWVSDDGDIFVRRHHVDKTAKSILEDVRAIVAANSDATFSFSSASLGYPVFAALFGDDGKYTEEMRSLMTVDANTQTSRLAKIVLTTPARGFLKLPYIPSPTDGWINYVEGPEELFLSGIFAEVPVTVIHDGEGEKYHAPQIYSAGYVTYVYPYSLSDPIVRKGDPPMLRRYVQTISRTHSVVHRQGVEWLAPRLIWEFFSGLTDKPDSYHVRQAIQIVEANVSQQAEVRKLPSEAFGIYETYDAAAVRRASGARLDRDDFNAAKKLGGVRFSTPNMAGEANDLSGLVNSVLKKARQ